MLDIANEVACDIDELYASEANDIVDGGTAVLTFFGRKYNVDIVIDRVDPIKASKSISNFIKNSNKISKATEAQFVALYNHVMMYYDKHVPVASINSVKQFDVHYIEVADYTRYGFGPVLCVCGTYLADPEHGWCIVYTLTGELIVCHNDHGDTHNVLDDIAKLPNKHLYRIEPGRFIDSFIIGKSRAEIHKLNGKPDSSFKKSKDSKNTTDVYQQFHVYYDESDVCEYIELHDSNGLSIMGEPIPQNFNEVVSFVHNNHKLNKYARNFYKGHENTYYSDMAGICFGYNTEGILSYISVVAPGYWGVL